MGRNRCKPALAALATLLACVGAGGLAGASEPVSATAGISGASELRQPPTRGEARAAAQRFLEEEEPSSKGGGGVGVPGTPRGSGGLFPRSRVVSFYGAPRAFGVLGRRSLEGAAEKLARKIKPYRKRTDKPVIKAFDLVATMATRCQSAADKCRFHQPAKLVRRYLEKAREVNARLILDIQPGRASVLSEIDHWRPFIRRPRVDVAIDAEWAVGAREEPGADAGHVRATTLNRASSVLGNIVHRRKLGDKALIVHQFHRDSIRRRAHVHQREDIDVTVNFDGIGSAAAKKAGYRQLRTPGLYHGFSLFFQLDAGLMQPGQVLELNPSPRYVMYQ